MQPSPARGPLRSSFANDPDMKELVELFVTEIPQRMDALSQALDGQRLDDVRRMAHQLRGSSGSYGFPTLGQAAGRIEDAIKTLPTASPDLLEVTRCVDELVSMCRRLAI